MRAKDYRDAMDALPLPEGMEERFRAAVESRRTAPRRFRRLGAALIAAAVVLAAALGTALAASESFRAAVFSFFRLGTAERYRSAWRPRRRGTRCGWRAGRWRTR